MFNAIIIGGTGATGRVLLEELIKNKNCKKITSIGRRHISKNDKLINIVVQSMFQLDSTIKYWSGNDVFFNCIGTTRKKAGNAQNFIDIELGISKIAARIASKSKVPHGVIISARGANHSIWAPKWFHPLLYIKTMGQKEQTIISDFDFKTASVFRPGLLDRNVNKTNSFGLSVKILAKSMMLIIENILSEKVNEKVKYFEGNENIKNVLNM